MQCNQAFCGNGFTNGPFYSCNNAPFQCNQSMYPGIVGEGDVTSVTLPDGTIQFFFMPTVKWWSNNASTCQPNTVYHMFAHTNCNILPSNNNAGIWFVRSISNPLPCQRSDIPRPYNNSSDYNMSNSCHGYPLKFHNDNWTSTTDIHYFYPSLRQRDYVTMQPCRDNAAVQIQTAPEAKNTIHHYEVACSKPCNCKCGSKPMSLVSVVQPKSTTKCYSGSIDDASCNDDSKKREQKKRNKSKIICGCDSKSRINAADKSVTTYTDEGSSCTPAGGQETQTCQDTKCEITILRRCDVKEAETWHPATPLSKKAMQRRRPKTSKKIDTLSDNDDNYGCSSNCSFNSK